MEDIKFRVLICLCFAIVFQSCTESKKDLVISNSCEWELKKAFVNDKPVQLTKYKIIYLIFHENGTYSYSKKIDPKASKHFQNTDNLVYPKYKWKINSSRTRMHISSFGDVKLIKLDSDTLAFLSKNIKYYFVCSNKTKPK